jgi:uncharacterized membrane protein YsdA (DUF1294 family)
MRNGYPRALFVAVAILCVVSVIALAVWLVYFITSPDAAYAWLAPGQQLWLTAVLSGCAAVSFGLLAFHYRRVAYGEGEEVVFRTCCIVLTGIMVCSGAWAMLGSLFG